MVDFNDNVEAKYKWRREVVFMILAGLFLGSLTMLNILGSTKTIAFTFLGVPVSLLIGVLPYPITFLCTDFISEIFGRRRASMVVWIGFIRNLWVVFILWVGGVLPKDPVVDDNIFLSVRNLALPTTFASMIAYLTAQFCDVHIFHFFKKLTKGKHLWLRNNASTLISQLVDSIAVILILYYFSDIFKNKSGDEIVHLIVSAYVFKFIVALLDTIPFYFGTKLLSDFLKIDHKAEYADK